MLNGGKAEWERHRPPGLNFGFSRTRSSDDSGSQIIQMGGLMCGCFVRGLAEMCELKESRVDGQPMHAILCAHCCCPSATF